MATDAFTCECGRCVWQTEHPDPQRRPSGFHPCWFVARRPGDECGYWPPRARANYCPSCPTRLNPEGTITRMVPEVPDGD